MSISRRSFLSLPLLGPIRSIVGAFGEDDLAFLRQMTLDVLAASRVQPGSNGPRDWPYKNSCGFALVTPGKGGYPAFWIRDFTMATDSGLVPSTEIRQHLFLVARSQNGATERTLKSGGIIPPYAIPDHINFDGSPVFYPGTYSSGEDQGRAPWGPLPPADDHYEFIHLAYRLWRQTKDTSFLHESVGGLEMMTRLKNAFSAPTVDSATGLFQTDDARRAVGFGFCDAVQMSGKLLMPSLLRWRAAGELLEMTREEHYRDVQRNIERSIGEAFRDSRSGWLLAATEACRQPDVWGTLYALHLGLLDKGVSNAATDTVSESVRKGTILLDGAVRHVPTDRDFSASTAWERSVAPKGSYQNGAYWHTPTGWLLSALREIDSELFRQVRDSFVQHMRKFDYRRSGDRGGAPWECIGLDGEHRQNPAYLSSIALPYSILKSTK